MKRQSRIRLRVSSWNMSPFLSRLTVGFFLFALGGAASVAGELRIRLEPHTLKVFDGRTPQVELGRLTVPENRASRMKPARTIEVGLYRLKGKNVGRNTLIAFLMGGPGISGTLMAQISPYYALFERLSESADVIVLDQRGLGTGSPRLDCPPPPPHVWHATSAAALLRRPLDQVESSASNPQKISLD